MTLSFPPYRPLLAAALATLLAVPGAAQDPAVPRQLNIVIVEGEGAVNNARQRVARERGGRRVVREQPDDREQRDRRRVGGNRYPPARRKETRKSHARNAA